MKNTLIQLGRRMANWPIIGRFVRIGVAVIRLPHWRDQFIHQHAQSEQQLAAIQAQINLLSSEQLPTLLRTISDVNSRQAATDLERDNLAQSLPIVLRKNHRDVVALRAVVEQAAAAVAGKADISDLAELRQALETFQTETTEALDAQAQLFAKFHESYRTFSEEQLPALLQTVSDINGRQPSVGTSPNNLIESLPTTLREIARDVAELQARYTQAMSLLAHKADNVAVQALAMALDAANTETNAALAGKLAPVEGRVESLAATANYLLNRIEFIRREVMLEMRYGATRDDQADGDGTEVVIAEPERWDEARRNGGLKLNLGCGHIPLKGYFNVDRRALPGVDVVAEVDALPLEPGEAKEIFSAHVLEHFPEEQLRRTLLPYWVSLLKPGGTFRAVVPDADTMIREYVTNGFPWADLREVTFGGQDYAGDFHYTMFTPSSLTDILRDAGLQDVRVTDKGRRNGQCYEFEIEARAPAI